MQVKVSKAVAFYMVLGMVITWIAEKVQALPEYLNWFGMGYWIMLVILVLLPLIPSTKVVNDSG